MTNKKDIIDNELSIIPNEKYKKLFEGFSRIETLPVEQWGKTELLGYFCKKYKEAYGIDYPWKFNTKLPSKCFEVWQLNTLVAKLSANPQILKDYIDWAYLKLVPQAKRRLTSISFMTKDEVVNPYKMNVLLGGKKNLNMDRSTPLPEKYKDIVKVAHGVELSTYGELAFLHSMYLDDADIKKRNDWMNTIFALEQAGFDTEIIGRIV
jgi:hypothetical protein